MASLKQGTSGQGYLCFGQVHYSGTVERKFFYERKKLDVCYV